MMRHELEVDEVTTAKAPRKEWEAPDVLARPIPFVACSEREFSIWLLGYETGYGHGFDRGAEYRDEEWQALHDRARRIVRAVSTWPERKR
jgi:hypothetical protein